MYYSWWPHFTLYSPTKLQESHWTPLPYAFQWMWPMKCTCKRSAVGQYVVVYLFSSSLPVSVKHRWKHGGQEKRPREVFFTVTPLVVFSWLQLLLVPVFLWTTPLSVLPDSAGSPWFGFSSCQAAQHLLSANPTSSLHPANLRESSSFLLWLISQLPCHFLFDFLASLSQCN